MILAKKTLARIEELLEKDGGQAYKSNLAKVTAMMLENKADGYHTDKSGRGHLGVSGIGEECARKIWFSYRNVLPKKLPGKLIRLYNRGHLEEARFLALLMMLTEDVYYQHDDGKQIRIAFEGGHFGSAVDGFARGLPDFEMKEWVLLEFKTHNEKSFRDLEKNGVKYSQPKYYAQISVYLKAKKLKHCLYMGVNKNTDEIHAEIIPADKEIGEYFIDRGLSILAMNEPPKGISSSAAFFKCKMCDFSPVCHKDAKVQRNCRTCVYWEPVSDGTWNCRKHRCGLTLELQNKGCSNHTLIKGLK